MSRITRPIALKGMCIIAISAMFPVLGWFSGWLVGYSRAPVVSAFLPVLFGLAGGLSFGLLERRSHLADLLSRIKDRTDATTEQKVKDALGHEVKTSLALPAFWSIGVMIFCLTCYLGLTRGIQQRTIRYASFSQFMDSIELDSTPPKAPAVKSSADSGPDRPSLAAAVKSADDVEMKGKGQNRTSDANIPKKNVTEEDMVMLNILWFQLESRGVQEETSKLFIKRSVLPYILSNSNNHRQLHWIIELIGTAQIDHPVPAAEGDIKPM